MPEDIPPRSSMDPLAFAFIDRSRRYLRDDYLPKIERAIALLSEDDVWWRPNEASNSIGNLLLHLSGNVRQWIMSGVGGAVDIRQRQKEFDTRQVVPVAALLEHLRTTIEEVDLALAALHEDDLLQHRHIQGNEVTVLEAVFHVVEHFSMHTGQILWIAKLRTGTDLTLYNVTSDGRARPNW